MAAKTSSLLLILGGVLLGLIASMACCCSAFVSTWGASGHDPGVTEYPGADHLDELETPLVYPEILSCAAPTTMSRPEDKGSAKALVGDQLSVVVFVDVPGHEPWSDVQRGGALKAVSVAHRWLEQEAARYGTTLKMKTLTLPGTHQARASDVELDTQAQKLELLRQLTTPMRTQGSPQDWVSHLKQDHQVDGASLLVFYNSPGRAWANAFIRGGEQWLDPAFLYLEDPQWPEALSSVVAHEMLHTYGADDLYHETPLSKALGALNYDMGTRIKSLWPESIMLSAWAHPGSIRRYVDPFNAWLVGWTTCVDEPLARDLFHNSI